MKTEPKDEKGGTGMTCFTCKGDMEKSLTTYMTECDGCFPIIKNVPCSKCTQCGEKYLNGVTLQKIEAILENLKQCWQR